MWHFSDNEENYTVNLSSRDTQKFSGSSCTISTDSQNQLFADCTNLPDEAHSQQLQNPMKPVDNEKTFTDTDTCHFENISGESVKNGAVKSTSRRSRKSYILEDLSPDLHVDTDLPHENTDSDEDLPSFL